jgi:GNAT superfamily N-acetyltransferase
LISAAADGAVVVEGAGRPGATDPFDDAVRSGQTGRLNRPTTGLTLAAGPMLTYDGSRLAPGPARPGIGRMAAAPTADEAAYRLSRPSRQAEWDAYREIRRSVHFEDEDSEDPPPDQNEDLAPGNYPLLLWLNGRPVGAIRIDSLDGGGAAFRLVAIHPACQGQGHGRVLLREAEAFAREIGCQKAVIYSTLEAAGFYASAGYAEDVWDDQYFGGVVLMTKPLQYPGFDLPDDKASSDPT